MTDEIDVSFAYIDSETQAVVVSNSVPDTVSMYWIVEKGADPNSISVDPTGDIYLAEKPREYPWEEPDFETGGWIDPRSEVEKEMHRQSIRRVTSLSKIDFLLRAQSFGIISKADALAAAKGEIPVGLSSFITDLTESERFEAEVRWGAAVRVDRLDPLILKMSDGLGISETQLDALFEVNF